VPREILRQVRLIELRTRGWVESLFGGEYHSDDVKAIGADVLRHRIITSYEAEAEEISADDIVARVFEAVDVP
jgi:hypothetical protein